MRRINVIDMLIMIGVVDACRGDRRQASVVRGALLTRLCLIFRLQLHEAVFGMATAGRETETWLPVCPGPQEMESTTRRMRCSISATSTAWFTT